MDRPTSTWLLVRLAVVCSEEAYNATVVSSAWRRTAPRRALVSQRPVLSHGEVVVVALSGTKGFRDWMVNLNNRACSPKDVLGQQNLCHAGFLEASKSLIDPLAASLAKFEDGSTLIFTGHSAGAATASLLYAHVLSKAASPLATVAKGFPNVHCILFGCPPVSVHPLQHHTREDERSSNSLFLSFLNDGDPIIKADAGYLVRRLGWPISTSSDACSSGADWQGKGTAPITGLAAKPPNRFFVHSGSTFLLALDIDSPLETIIKEVSNDELDDEAAMSWRVHGISVYRARIESCQAGHDYVGNNVRCPDTNDNHKDDISTRMCVKEWVHWLPIMFL
ncbi:hypothetical protein AA0119_g12874 [Alternaria tenuissima]|uniref:Fungal lipase-type domain-containing protein n=2 Tax=Alternaria alternata complex TaxID=187734 RepID=A0A4Q4MZT6_ALTAL|nr:hypothetical protein AA0117_g12700 [Alternaria alternata]RYN86447.1 hypothetical protein AA0119_g12874 [Alternaria tenuissima]RYO04022.1 hypothetical protein AA0121_g12881 [Alternaria tenuissima]